MDRTHTVLPGNVFVTKVMLIATGLANQWRRMKFATVNASSLRVGRSIAMLFRCYVCQSSCSRAFLSTRLCLAFFANNAAHCGTCSNSCGENEMCSEGQCICEVGHEVCNGGCVETSSKTCVGIQMVVVSNQIKSSHPSLVSSFLRRQQCPLWSLWGNVRTKRTLFFRAMRLR